MKPLTLGVVAFAATVRAQNLTSLVNLFIGTASGANGGSGGNAFPGAAVPHAMVKVGIDVTTAPRQAGYIADNSTISGISLMHDEGTGGNVNGGYGIFPLFPLADCAFTECPVLLSERAALRAEGADAATPGYFTTTFVNGIQTETTSTRRAGLVRFTYPESASSHHVVIDLTNDLQRSFRGGALDVSATNQVSLSGTFMQSYGPENYTAYACYDFQQTPAAFGTYEDSAGGNATTISINGTSLSYDFDPNGVSTQAGALFSFSENTVVARFGISMVSSAQACANAEAEVPSSSESGWDWDAVQGASNAEWESVLGRVRTDTASENATIVELLYSSLYRTLLVPADLTGENPYWGGQEPFYDALFCSWDTFRTVHPWLSLIAPVEWAEIVRSYVDGWRNTGYIPECRANTKAGYVQGGSDGMPILGDFAVKYADQAGQLGVDMDDLYQALVDTAENTPPDWYRVGRQNTAWKEFGYIPTDWEDPSGSTGLPTREASRAFEYALGDFAVRQTAKTLGKSDDDIEKYENRSMNFVNMWDGNLTHDGFTGFAQRRYPNGSFAYSPPDACSPVDPAPHSCSRGEDNDVGFYQSSSWEMSFFAPHSVATIVDLMGGNDTFVERVAHYFDGGYFQAGNEPSFLMPWISHYAGRPDLSASRVRQAVNENFGTGIGGIPGNDDSGAMGALLIFHILGLYPVVSTREFLIGAPLLSKGYTLSNELLGTETTFTVSGSGMYVTSITVGGEAREGVCVIDWEDVVGGQEVVLTVDNDPVAAQERGCEGRLPASLGTGGFT